ncbi:MAG TPA: TonB-dependent receptor [Terriglobales bacterium]|nr:TonB-dependent receptor [Terriglobales bacterium]
MKTKSLVCAACLVLFLLTTLSAGWGQSLAGGTIAGTVTDASGAVVPGATVTVLNTANGAKQETSTSSDGLFQFPVLAAGKYTLTVTKAGFATVQQSDVSLAVGGELNLPVKMPVASKGETVNVTSEVPVIETTRTQVSSNVNERSIHDLPVNGRNFIDFVLLTPGVTRDVRTGDLSFAGQRGTLNSLTVDGADNNNSFFGQTTGRTGSGRAPYQFSQDAVQEFQVNSNSYSAELGRAGGAVVNVITKSGTNTFHGTAFEFYRDQSLNANDPIAVQNAVLGLKPIPVKPKYHFNQFGGNLGGPIIKDKLFFFFDYDGQRNHQPNTVTYVAPARTAGNAAALDYLSGLTDSYTRGLNQDTYMTKVDWNAGKHQVSGRWNRQLFTGSNFENGGPTNAEQHTGDSNVHTDTVTGSVTSTLTNSMVNQLRVTFLRDSEPGLANSNNPEAVIRSGNSTLITIGRNSFSPRETTIKHWQYADNISWVRGRHTLKVGADMVQDKILNFFPGNFSGAYTFNSLDDFASSLNGTNTGGVSYSQAFAGPGTTGPTTHPDILQWALFLQDDWRVTNKLTLNLGLRYDEQRIKQPTVQNPVALAAGFNTAQIPVDSNNVGPRLGFAYAPTSKLVIRGGYGMFYGSTPSIMIGTAMSNNGINVGTLSFAGTAAPTYPNTFCGAPVPSPSCAAPTSGGTPATPSIYVFSKDFKNPLIHQANVGVEYGLGKDWSVSLGYIYVGGDDLQRTRDVNLANPSPATIGIAGTTTFLDYMKYPSTRPVAGFARIAQFESTASSNYNGMTFQVNRRFAQNYQLSVAYTWSHVLDNAPDATSVVPFSSGDDAKMIQDPLNINGDYASGVNDMRHRFVVSGVWDLNAYTTNMNRIVKGALGGWELSSIFTAQSGQPYSAVLGSDLNNDSNRQTDRTPGLGRNTFNLPATYSLDPRITRTVNITEGTKLQFFAEAFNVLNHFNVTGVRNQQYALSTPLNQAQCGTAGIPCLIPQDPAHTTTAYFGLPNATSGQRIIQLGAKFSF